MKYFYLSLALLVFSISPVSAQFNLGEGGNKSNTQQRQQNVNSNDTPQLQMQDKREQVLQKRNEVREKVSISKQQRIINHTTNLQNHFSVYYSRLLTIIEKMESNDTISSNPEAVAMLNQAKDTLEEAKVSGETAVYLFGEVTLGSGTDTSDQIKEAITYARLAREQFTSVHTSLKDVVVMVNGGVSE